MHQTRRTKTPKKKRPILLHAPYCIPSLLDLVVVISRVVIIRRIASVSCDTAFCIALGTSILRILLRSFHHLGLLLLYPLWNILIPNHRKLPLGCQGPLFLMSCCRSLQTIC
ncbi:hypothetical protein FPQ18DRAFT_313150 [Pyronema domesticum]|nr:hypothetical protein FPQ18DRAFT_313150 [Pyronema domesticum]